ncbi:YidB family protein [Streptomyces sannanensis]|uniref:YidB family protein n=1 Tax=Streptomyces sannanensis TaxID=285536 RepID=A0ABP6S3D7_9ACTN
MADDDLGTLLGSLLGGKQAGEGTLLSHLLSALGDSGQGGGNPLQALIEELQDGGLGGKAQSWVSTGQNQPLSGPEVAQALPYQLLDSVAERSGLSPEQAADQLAVALPPVVDRLTPQGEVPQGSLEDLIRRQL